MRLVMMLQGTENIRWAHARQMGVSGAVAKLAPDLTGLPPPYDLGSLKASVARYAKAGFEIVALEGDQFDMSRIKRGLPGRDEDLEHYRQMLRNVAAVGIQTVAYNFMVGIAAHRSTHGLRDRGGAVVSGYDRQADEARGLTELGEVTSETVFENYRYFLSAILPIAEEVGVRMGLHPDDPPVPVLRGIGRPFGTSAGIERALALSDSPSHGLNFCQGTYASADEDVPALLREWGSLGRIAFAHFRDVRGTPDSFHETFPDIGQTDHATLARIYAEIGYEGYIRPDHAPAMEGDPVSNDGCVQGSHMVYSPRGMLFTTGFMRGVFAGAGNPLT